MEYIELIEKLSLRTSSKEEAKNLLFEDYFDILSGNKEIRKKYGLTKKECKEIALSIQNDEYFKDKLSNVDKLKESIVIESNKHYFKKKIKDIFDIFLTYFSSGLTLLIVFSVFIFIFSKGWNTLSFDMIVGDNQATVTSFKTSDGYSNSLNHEYLYVNKKENEYFSKYWGVAFIDAKNNIGEEEVEISFVATDSPLNFNIVDYGNNAVSFEVGSFLDSATLFLNDGTSLIISSKSSQKPSNISSNAEWFQESFDKCTEIFSGNIYLGGEGIRGSLITTFYTIILTLLISLPLGIGGAIYLGFYAKKNKLTGFIRSIIDLLSGIPSIIYGLVGALIFIPLVNGGGKTGSVISGVLTLSIMVLPIIIKNVEEAINAIPKSLKEASFALGGSESQTIFKIILPNARSGIFTGSILASGRIIGESAALIYAVGTTIQDNVLLNQPSTTLATHIWTLMAGDIPNYEAACAISIIILLIVLLLNLILIIIDHYSNIFKKKNSTTLISKLISKIKLKKEQKNV